MPNSLEPVDEARDDRDGQRLGQRHEEERCQFVVGQQHLGSPHPLAQVEQILHQRVLLLLALAVGEQILQRRGLLAALHHLVDPHGVDAGHAQQAAGVGGGRGVEDVGLVLVLEHQVNHVLEHGRLFERRVHGRRLDELVGLGLDVGKLQEPLDLLANLLLGLLDGVLGVDLVGRSGWARPSPASPCRRRSDPTCWTGSAPGWSRRAASSCPGRPSTGQPCRPAPSCPRRPCRRRRRT